MAADRIDSSSDPWAELHGWRRIDWSVGAVPGFKDACRRFATHMLCSTYQKIPKAVIGDVSIPGTSPTRGERLPTPFDCTGTC